jgi:hypothetical protein
MKLKITEAEVKRAIMDYLSLQEKLGKCYYIRNNTAFGQFKRPNGSVGWINQGRRGSPDIVACIKGTFVAIECKSSIGKMSPEQKVCQSQIEKLGGKYILAKGVEDIEGLFK